MLMNATIIAGIIGTIFIAFPLIMRSKAVFMFLTLCAGVLLADLVAKDVTNIVNSIISLNIPVYSIVQIVLMVIVPIIILFLFRRSVKTDIIWQIVPAVAAAVVCFMQAVNMLPYDLQNNLMQTDLYLSIKTYYGVAVAGGVLFCLFYFFTNHPKHSKSDKKHHKK